MKSQVRFVGVFVFTALVSQFCFAAEPSTTTSQVLGATSAPENVSTTTVTTEQRESVFDNLYADLFTVYHGPVLDNLGSAKSVNNKGVAGQKNPMYFDNELTTAFLVDKSSGIGIGPDVPFWVTPVMGQGLTLGDVGIKAFDKKFVDTGNLRIYMNGYFQLPTSQYSSDVRHVNYAVKTTPYWWYHFSGSRFMIGSWNEVKTYVGASDYTFKLYSMPYVNYQLTSKLSANVGYEMEAHHMVNKPTFDFTTYETDLQPGFVYLITPTILVNPYVQLFTGNRVTSDSTAIGAVITARLL